VPFSLWTNLGFGKIKAHKIPSLWGRSSGGWVVPQVRPIARFSPQSYAYDWLDCVQMHEHQVHQDTA